MQSPGQVTTPEVLAWTGLVAVLWSISGYVNWLEFELRKIEISPIIVAVNEASSGLAALLMVLFVRAWLTRFPLAIASLPKSLPAHLLGSLVFSLGHVGIMIGVRFLTYGAIGWTYRPAIPDGDYGFLKMLAYEYGKDFPVYAVFLLIIFLYRLYRVRQTQAAQAPSRARAPNKIRVRAGNHDLLLEKASIDWFQAASNYAQVFASGDEYLIRGTLSDLEAKLSEGSFVRVHRSFIVNLDKVAKIRPADSGGLVLEVNGGMTIPVGRKYKDRIESLLSL